MQHRLELAALAVVAVGFLSAVVVPSVGAVLVTGGAYALVLPKFIEPEDPTAG